MLATKGPGPILSGSGWVSSKKLRSSRWIAGTPAFCLAIL